MAAMAWRRNRRLAAYRQCSTDLLAVDMDALARAYAILGVPAGCSAVELKRAYRTLVKRWHPDQFAGDALGEAEATRQLSAINQAMRLVARHLGTVRMETADRKRREVRKDAWQPTEDARPLSGAELDAMLHAIGDESPVDIALEYVGDVGLFVIGFVCFVPQKGALGPSVRDMVLGVVCIAGGLLRLAWRKYKSRG